MERRRELAGKNLLEYLKEAGFEPEQVVVERNLEIVPKGQTGQRNQFRMKM